MPEPTPALPRPRGPRTRITRSRLQPDGSSAAAVIIDSDDARRPASISLTAAAHVLTHKKVNRKTKPVSAWQTEAWAMLDQVGELWFAGLWLASALSRVRITAAKMSDNGDEPRILGGRPEPANYAGLDAAVADTDGDDPAGDDLHALSDTDRRVARIVAHWADGPAGQEQVLYRAGFQLAIAADTYLVARRPREDEYARDDDDVEPLVWRAYSDQEISARNGGWAINEGANHQFDLDADALVVRCWRPHPARFRDAGGAVRAALPVLRELKGLSAHISAQVDSRLAGAGLLLLPQSITFGSATAQGQAAGEEDGFLGALMEAMLTPLADRESAAAVVPLVAQVPDEALGKSQHIKFADPALDKAVQGLRDSAIHRLSLALDMPAEVLTGLGDTNHWSAWQIDESAIKLHVAPVAALVCHALTVGWLHPLLRALGVEDADDYLVWFDTTPLVLRPDRSTDAKELFDRAAIGSAALRREAGFAETDAPTDLERKEQLLLKMAERAPTLAPLALALLGFDLPETMLDQVRETAMSLSGIDPDAPPIPGQRPENPIRDARSISKDERRQIAARGTARASGSSTGPRPGSARGGSESTRAIAASAGPCPLDPALVEACHLAVLHALSYAGKRMVSSSRRHQSELRPLQQTHPFTLHTHVRATDPDHLLDGAWTTLRAARPDAERLVPVLDDYVRSLLEHQMEHSRDYLATALRQASLCAEVPA